MIGSSKPETPDVCDRRWRTLTPALPLAANSGQYEATRASRSSAARAVIVFVVENTLVIVFAFHGAVRVSFAQPPPQIDHHLAIDVDGERGAEVFPRLDHRSEQVSQGVEAVGACAAQQRLVITHEASIQQSQLKLARWMGKVGTPSLTERD